VIGATHATKRMPPEQIARICQALPGPVVLLGGPAEQPAAGLIAGEGGGAVIDLTGRLSLAASAAVLQEAAIVISHDTGLMHIAAALRRRVISIWGSTVPAFGMYPFYPDSGVPDQKIEVKGLFCRPCSKIGYDKCPKGHFRCMREIEPEAVVQAHRALLHSGGNVV
jgi:ADP-heptose:LPS heptosyltransferase